MYLLFGLVLITRLVSAVALGPICAPFSTECHDSTCTAGAFLGSLVNQFNCPFVRMEDGTVNRQCVACASGSTCTPEGTCADASTLLGISCASDEECNAFIPDISEAPNRCDAGVCVKDLTDLMLPGDEGCSANSDCFGNSQCVTGVCAGSVVCSDSRECAPGKRCTSGICLAQALVGGICDVSTDCHVTQMCNFTKCTNRFTLDDAELCGFEEITRNYGCSAGLQCIQVGDTSEYHCDTTPVVALGCNVLITGECPQSYTCDCDLDDARGTCKPETEDGRCANQWMQLFQCADVSACRPENVDRIFDGSCIRSNCFSQWSSLQKCRYPTELGVFSSTLCEIVRRTEIKSGNLIAPLKAAAAGLPNVF